MADTPPSPATGTPAPAVAPADAAPALPANFERLSFAERTAAIRNMAADAAPRLPADGQGDLAYHARIAAIERQRSGASAESAEGVAPKTAAPTMDQFLKTLDSDLSGPQGKPVVQPAAEGEPDVKLDAPAPDAAAIPETAAEYTVTLPSEITLPPDMQIDAGVADRIRQFAHARQLPQGMVTEMAGELAKVQLEAIAAQKSAFDETARAVVAEVGRDRIIALGKFFDATVPAPVADALRGTLLAGKDAVAFFEAAQRAMSGDTRPSSANSSNSFMARIASIRGLS
jgi:hypothetical protein